MVIVFDGPVLPEDTVEFARLVPVPAQFVLNRILPDVHVPSNDVNIAELIQTNRTARFRAYDGNIHRTQRDVANLKRVHLPPLSDSIAVGEYERLQLEFARTGGTNNRALVDAIYDDVANLTRYVHNRMEQARGDVLADGKFTLAGEGGLTLEADFGVPAGNFVTAPVLWSHAAADGSLDADIMGQLNTWVTAYILLNGFPPGGMWISRSVLTLILSNGTLKYAAGTLLGVSTFLTMDQLQAQLAARGLPPILGVYDSMVDVDGTATRVLPSNKIIFTPPESNPLGRTVWGVSGTALELVNSAEVDMAFEEAPGIVAVIEKDGPPYRQYTYVDAVGMPVIDRPNTLMVATVA